MDWMTYSTEKAGNLAPKNRKKMVLGGSPWKKILLKNQGDKEKK